MKIKNCPFCGSEVELKKLPLWNGSHGYFGCYEYVIFCDKCGCNKHLGSNNTVYNTNEEARQNAIDSWNMRAEQIPSVTSTRHKGKWVEIDEESHEKWKCNICGYVLDGSDFLFPISYKRNHKFCPNCGAEMEVENGS